MSASLAGSLVAGVWFIAGTLIWICRALVRIDVRQEAELQRERRNTIRRLGGTP